MHSIDRRTFIASLAMAGAAAGPAMAQDGFPGKGPLRLIVPLPPGGAADVSARLLVATLQERMQRTFIVDNRPGGSFSIGMQAFAQAVPDGTTLMQINIGMCAAQAALGRFDLQKALVPVSLIASAPAILCVSAAQSRAQTVQDLIASGRARPGTLNYGSVGVGTMEHLWGHAFSREHALGAVNIPFKGMPEAATALVGGEVQFLSLIYPVAAPLVQKGLLRPLAMLDARRHPALPDLPTLKELGVTAPDLVFWAGIAVPAGTPAAVVELLHREIAAVAQDAGYREKLAGIGAVALSSATPAEFARLVDDELRWMAASVKAADLRLS
jgi:tripartite-type tricarboxylate transporter receptor subunit TctC